MVRKKLNPWLDRQPLWVFVLISYAACFVTYTAWVYVLAWATGGVRAGDLGFPLPQGAFSYSLALSTSAMGTVLLAGYRWRRLTQRGGKAFTPMLLLAALGVFVLLLVVTSW
jgi:hypothetical protein